jgi:hypothetical protein
MCAYTHVRAQVLQRPDQFVLSSPTLINNGSVHNSADDKHGGDDSHLLAEAAVFRAHEHDNALTQIPMPINEQAQQQAVEIQQQQLGKVVLPAAGGAASKDGANAERRLFIIQV